MRKRIIHIGAVALFALGLLTSCDLIEECGTCERVTEVSGSVTERGTSLPVCGDLLKEKEDQPPVTIGVKTTYWYCY